jgi:hypothetical protein
MILGLSLFLYGVKEILISLTMAESSGLGALAKQGTGLIYISIGLIIFLLIYLLKKKSVI